MKEAVSAVLDLRSPTPAGLSRLIWWSGAIHLGVAAAVLVWQVWSSRPHDDTIMMISLSGSLGQETSGLTPIGGKQVDQVAPEPKRPEPTPVQSAPKPDEMTLPTRPAAKAPPPKRDPAPQTSSVVRPATGARVTTGSSVIDTGAKGESTGLAQGGGGTNATVDKDFEFCCKAYLDAMLKAIRDNINLNVGGHGIVVIKFEVARDGSIARPSIKVEKSAGSALDSEAQYAVRATTLPPLPAEYKSNTLIVALTVQF